jgi:ABC-type sulfate transport system permease component
VLLPLAAVGASALDGGISGFWDQISRPQAVASLKFTVGVSAVVTAWMKPLNPLDCERHTTAANGINTMMLR